MKRFLLSVAAVTLSLALVAAAEAGPKGGRGSKAGNGHTGDHSLSGSHDSHGPRDYRMTHGTKLAGGGYAYKGKGQRHWSHRCWYGKYGCECYYCPYARCWYYWYQPACCYYPVNYLPACTPTPAPLRRATPPA